MKKKYNDIIYDSDTDYGPLIDEAVANGDYVLAGMREQRQNAKIAGEGMSEQPTFNYYGYLKSPSDDRIISGSPDTSVSAFHDNGISSDSSDGKYKKYDASDDIEKYASRRFSYDPESDGVLKAQSSQLRKNAADTAENVLGKYSSVTGGRPSSYAVSAAAKASADTLSGINDLYAAREAENYKRYRDSMNDNLNVIDMRRSQDSVNYSRMIDEMNSEAAAAGAEEENRLKWAEYELSANKNAAEIAKINAEAEKTGLESYYLPYEKEADINKTYADIGKVGAETGKINAEAEKTGLESYYLPYEKEADINKTYAETERIGAETDKINSETEYTDLNYQKNLEAALEHASAGAVSSYESDIINLAVENAKYKISMGDSLSVTDIAALKVSGYEINQSKIRKNKSEDLEAKDTPYSVYKNEIEASAARGLDDLSDTLAEHVEYGIISEEEAEETYRTYSMLYGTNS